MLSVGRKEAAERGPAGAAMMCSTIDDNLMLHWMGSGERDGPAGRGGDPLLYGFRQFLSCRNDSFNLVGTGRANLEFIWNQNLKQDTSLRTLAPSHDLGCFSV